MPISVQIERQVFTDTKRIVELSREEVLRILAESLGMNFESCLFKAQGLVKIGIVEHVVKEDVSPVTVTVTSQRQ